MKPIRVLMVVRLFYPWVGGAERQAHKLAQTLLAKGVDVQLVTGWWFWGTPQREILAGVPVFRNLTLWEFFGLKGLRKFGGYLYIVTLLWHLWRQRASYDLIHIHGLNYHTFAAVLGGRWWGRKTLCKLANSGPASDITKMRQSKQLALARYMLPTALRCDRFVALNRLVGQELTAAGVPARHITELPNGVETGQIAARTDYALRQPASIVYVGRLHPQKRLDVLLAAFERLRRQVPQANLRLQLVGDGPQRQELTDLAGRLDIAPQVDFVGQSEQVLAHLAQADAFVLPSDAEGISNALLEAMAAGLPVVASNIPGNAAVVTHGQNGLLFAPGDAAALAAGLHNLLTQEPLRRRLGLAARATVERRFSLDYVAERYMALYQELLLPQAAHSQTRLATTQPSHIILSDARSEESLRTSLSGGPAGDSSSLRSSE